MNVLRALFRPAPEKRPIVIQSSGTETTNLRQEIEKTRRAKTELADVLSRQGPAEAIRIANRRREAVTRATE